MSEERGAAGYVLGTSDHELERLRLQQEVWGPITTGFLDRLLIPPGATVLDLGCGPGFLLDSFRDRVGPEGVVIGVDESRRWIDQAEARIRRHAWSNVRAIRSRIQDVALDPESVDLIFMRWVLGFLEEPARILADLAGLLRPGGGIAVMDYNHEGVSLFPESEGFRAAVRATRDLYTSRGGDPWVMGRIRGYFRRAGLRPALFEPHVIAGGPDSPAFRWADSFFPFHVAGMVESGVLEEDLKERFLADWSARKRDPDTLFFSPIVVGAFAAKPGNGS